MRKNRKEFLKFNAYLGCELPRPFFLRFQAMSEIRGGDKRTLLAMIVEEEITRWEKKLDQRTGTAYDALLETKARNHDFSVDELKEPLELKRLPKGKTGIPVKRGPVWPKLKRIK